MTFDTSFAEVGTQQQLASDLQLAVKVRFREGGIRDDISTSIAMPDGSSQPFALHTIHADSEDRTLLRIGSRVFMHDDLVRQLPKELIARAGDSLVRITSPSALEDRRLSGYTALSSVAAESLDLSGLHTLEIGSADGLLTIQALLKGAASGTAIDIDPPWKAAVSENMRLNGLADRVVDFRVQDVRRISEIRASLRDDYDVLFANLGPHYELADLATIRLLADLRRVKTFVGGGYAKTPQLSPTIALDYLREQGFSRRYQEFVSKDSTLPYMAFTVSRE